MEKIGLVLDSTIYLSDEELSRKDVKVVSLNILEGETVYKETDITPEFVFEQLDQGKELTTSQPAPEAFVKAYEEFLADGFEKIAVLTISRGLSGTYQSAMLAKEHIDRPEDVHVFDTQNAGFGNELIALEFLRFVEEEASFEAVVEKTNKVIDRAQLFFTVQNLFSLQKGGRLSRRKALLGTVLRIKPIIRLIEGKLELVHKERTEIRLFEYITNAIQEDVQEKGTLHVRIVHQKSEAMAKALKDKIKGLYEDAIVRITDYIGPVFAIHIGKKGLGIAWYLETS